MAGEFETMSVNILNWFSVTYEYVFLIRGLKTEQWPAWHPAERLTHVSVPLQDQMTSELAWLSVQVTTSLQILSNGGRVHGAM